MYTMKHSLTLLIYLIALLSFKNIGSAQSGGWGVCEFATLTTLNAFNPSGITLACKQAYVTATDEHYFWNGSAWVKETDDQQIETFSFDGTNLTLAIEGDGQADQSVNLSGVDINILMLIVYICTLLITSEH